MYQEDDVVEDDEEGVYSSMTEDEQQTLLETIIRSKMPHQRDLCQRCSEREGPCWVPHKPDDCARCQSDPRGLCYNPKSYK